MNSIRPVLRSAHLVVPLVLAVALLCAFTWTGSLPLDNDPLYADVARTMVRTGDFLNPRIHGVPFLDKPPLYFWCIAVCTSLFGDGIFALRLSSVLSGVLTALLVGVAADRGKGLAPGVAVAALLGSPLWFEYARRVYMEVPVGLCVLASLLALERAFRPDLSAGQRRSWALLGGLGLGLGFMIKSLVGLFPALAVGVWALLESRGRVVLDRTAWITAGLAGLVLAVIALPWHVYQLRTQRDIFLEFTWKLHVEQQLLSAQPWSTGPAWFYLRVLLEQLPLFGLMTFSALCVVATRLMRGSRIERLDRLLAVSIIVILAGLSVAETKKDLYLIPMVPITALLFARQIETVDRAVLRRSLVGVGVGSLLLDAPLVDPGGSTLQGASMLVPSARAARMHGAAGEPLYLVNLYFPTTQYYSEMRAISIFTQPGPAQMTSHIPYIRHGGNMIEMREMEIAQKIGQGGLWIVPQAVFFSIQSQVEAPITVLHRDRFFVLARSQRR